MAGGDPGFCSGREEAERARGFEAFIAGWRYGWKRGASASPREAEEQGYGTLVESTCFCRGSDDGASGDTWRLDRVAERCPGLAGAVGECKKMLGEVTVRGELLLRAPDGARGGRVLGSPPPGPDPGPG